MRTHRFLPLVVILVLASDARADWKLAKTPPELGCPDELGAGESPVAWTDGNATLAICSAAIAKDHTDILLTENHQISVSIGGAVTKLATEWAAGAKARRVRIRRETVEIATFLRANGPQLLAQTIRCTRGNCLLDSPVCTLVPSKDAESIVAALEQKLARVKGDARLAAWSDYFFEGKHLKDGDAVLLQAMRGDRRAASLVSAEVGADAAPAEVQAQLVEEVNEIAKACAPKGSSTRAK